MSHYIHEWSQRVLKESLERALDCHTSLIKCGHCGWQIEPYLEAFGVEAMLLSSLERPKADRDRKLESIAAHIEDRIGC